MISMRRPARGSAIAELSMGAGFPPLRRMADAGVRFALAIDSVLGSPPDMFAQMRAAAGLLRAGRWRGGEPPAGSEASDDRAVKRATCVNPRN